MLNVIRPSSQARQFTKRHYLHPDWAGGAILALDASFIFDLIAKYKPQSFLEIGVASGVSSAFIYKALKHVRADAELHSIDALNYFYLDKKIKLGQFVYEEFDGLPDDFYLYPRTPSFRIKDKFKKKKFDMIFIDAFHKHPSPCLDLLYALQNLHENSIIILHDVYLPFLYNHIYYDYGDYYLFQAWENRKYMYSLEAGVSSIGAIKNFADQDQTMACLLKCLSWPWQTTIDVIQLEKAHQAFTRISPKYADLFLRLAKKNS